MRGRAPRWRSLLAGGGALLAMLALAAALAWQQIFDYILASKLALTPHSRSFREWRAPTTPIYMDIFMFNWTNAHAFPEEKPHFEQLGPYRFRELRRHVNVTWHPQNYSVGYKTEHRWFFDPHTSNGSLSDNVTTINVIAASAAYRYRNYSYFQQKGLSMGLAIFGQQISISRTAEELLFEGYDDPMLDLAKSLPASTTGGAPPVDRFGLFYGRNNSIDLDGHIEVTTGVESGSMPGQILRWNYADHIPYYKGKCSKLIGSAGEFIPRTLTEESVLQMFIPDLCRSVDMGYAGSGELDGLPYHKYQVNEKSFDYSPDDPTNTCFCNGDCIWSGVMNVSACRYDSPMFITLPHFLYGDQRLLDMVTGLEPDPEKHAFYFTIEPKIGVPLDVAGRFQLNVYLEPVENIVLFQHVPRMLFPVIWVQQHVTIDSSVRAELRLARSTLEWGCALLAALAFVLAALVALSTCCRTREGGGRERGEKDAEVKLNPM